MAPGNQHYLIPQRFAGFLLGQAIGHITYNGWNDTSPISEVSRDIIEHFNEFHPKIYDHIFQQLQNFYKDNNRYNFNGLPKPNL